MGRGFGQHPPRSLERLTAPLAVDTSLFVARAGRGTVFAALAMIAVLCWAYTVAMPDMDAVMAEVEALASGAWHPWPGNGASFLFPYLFLMWAAMMVAMMMPAALPMLLAFDRVCAARRRSSLATGTFAAGYAVLWLGFALAATALEALMHGVALLTPGMASATPVLSGLLLLAAGAYQLSPLKNACLVRCRSPLAFILAEWRNGVAGAFVMGLRHGLFCLGCCGPLMALLFVGGVMNVLWIAALSVVVLLEKLAPSPRVAGVLGLGLIGWGGLLLATSW